MIAKNPIMSGKQLFMSDCHNWVLQDPLNILAAKLSDTVSEF